MTERRHLPSPVARVPRVAVREGAISAGARVVPEETAVAFTYNRMTHAVMMATPADLEDFAAGFSLSEGIIRSPDEIQSLDVVAIPPGHSPGVGIELRMDLAERSRDVFLERRRHLAGPSGCGLCGIDSLAEAMRELPEIASGLRLSPAQISEALDALGTAQLLNREARAIHAASFWDPHQGLIALREDVGRHNALDKLVGAVARRGAISGDGAVVLTSRVSIEMVQKVAIMGAPIIVAVSAPTALAIRTADAAGITLIGVARGDGFEIFTHSERIHQPVAHYVA